MRKRISRLAKKKTFHSSPFIVISYEFFTYTNKKKLNTETQRHGEKMKAEG
jgi:hypothetical protein